MWAKKPKKHGVRNPEAVGPQPSPSCANPLLQDYRRPRRVLLRLGSPSFFAVCQFLHSRHLPRVTLTVSVMMPPDTTSTTQHRTAWNVHCAPSSIRHWTHPTQNNGFSPSDMLLLESFLSQDLTSLSKCFRPKPRNCPAFPSQSYSKSDHFLSSLSLKPDAKPTSGLLDNLLPGWPTHFCRLQPTVHRTTGTCLWRYASFPVVPLLHILQKHPIATRIMSGASPGPWHPREPPRVCLMPASLPITHSLLFASGGRSVPCTCQLWVRPRPCLLLAVFFPDLCVAVVFSSGGSQITCHLLRETSLVSYLQ